MVIESESLISTLESIFTVSLLRAQIKDLVVFVKLFVKKELHLVHRVSVIRFKAFGWVSHRNHIWQNEAQVEVEAI